MSTFTGHKLDFLKAVRFDRRVGDYAYRVISTIADHVNERTGRTILSDDTIAYETGSAEPRKVRRARAILRECGWLTWHRTRTANIYELNHDNVASAVAGIRKGSAARRKRQQNGAEQKPDRTPASYLAVSSPDRTPVTYQDRTPVSAIHLRGTPSQRRGWPKKEDKEDSEKRLQGDQGDGRELPFDEELGEGHWQIARGYGIDDECTVNTIWVEYVDYARNNVSDDWPGIWRSFALRYARGSTPVEQLDDMSIDVPAEPAAAPEICKPSPERRAEQIDAAMKGLGGISKRRRT